MKVWERAQILGVAAFGALVASVLDAAVHPSNRDVHIGYRLICTGLGRMFGTADDGILIDTIAIILVCLLAALYSSYTNEKPGINCLLTGLAVYGILTLAENKIGQDATFTTRTDTFQAPKQQAPVGKGSYRINPSPYVAAHLYIKLVAVNNGDDKTADREACPGSLPVVEINGSRRCYANGRLTSRLDGLSLCRPHYFGFLGLGSFLSNSMEICPLSSDLAEKFEGQPVRVVKNFVTWPAPYSYSCFQVLVGGRLQTVWGQTGSGTDKFSSISFFPGQPEIVEPLGGSIQQVCGS